MTKIHKIILGVAVLALISLTAVFAFNTSATITPADNAGTAVTAGGCPHCATAVAPEACQKDACCCGEACKCCDGCETGNCTCEDCQCCDCCKKPEAVVAADTCCCGEACKCCDGCETGNCTCDDCQCCDCCKAQK